MPSIPPDVWGHIAQFIPQDDLCNMLNVNSALFQLAMDARYKDVAFSIYNDAMMKTIRRLSDPAVTHRVRSLYVNPMFSPPEAASPLITQDPSFRGNPHATFSMSWKEILQTMVDAVTCLSNVTDFWIDWRGLPSEDQLNPFLAAAWRTFGPGLRRVVTRAPLENLRALLSTDNNLISLKDFEVEIQHSSPDGKRENNSPVTVLASFINQIAPTLRRLSITSYERNLDLTPLFRSLGDIPNLERLNMAIEFNMCGLSETFGLTRVFRNHTRSLRHVKWTSMSPWSSDGLEENTLTDDSFKQWLKANSADEFILSNLLSLQVEIPRGPAGLYLTVPYIKRSADTLTSLSLLGGYLTYDEVHSVASAFSRRQNLKELGLHVQILSIELLLLFTRTFPCLDKLRLDILDVGGPRSAGTDDNWNDEAKVQEFAAQLKRQDIPHWQLHEIDITVYGGTGGGTARRIEEVFAECVPSCASTVYS